MDPRPGSPGAAAGQEGAAYLLYSSGVQDFAGIEANMEVMGDVESGLPVAYSPERQSWRQRTIHTYSAEHYGDQTLAQSMKRPFYKDYRFYKYYGYGGKGAKTAWGHNPKYSIILDFDPVDNLYTKNLHEVAADRPETTGCSAQSTKRVIKKSPYGSPSKSTGQRPGTAPASRGSLGRGSPQSHGAEAFPAHHVQESRTMTVDLQHMSSFNPRRPPFEGPRAKVVTYPFVTADHGSSFGPASPSNSGRRQGVSSDQFDKIQPPFHQRYSHYKHYGFAGHGAKSSWATSPYPGPYEVKSFKQSKTWKD